MKHLIFAALLATVVAAAPANVATGGFVVVVNSANDLEAATPAQISSLFLRKQQQWSNGQMVLPVDQDSQSHVRQAFTFDIHGRPVQAVEAYWRQKVFAGEAVPPLVLDSDGAVLEYVRSHAGAIGYISAATPLGEGVHPVAVTR